MTKSKITVPRDPSSHGAEVTRSRQVYARSRMPPPYKQLAAIAQANMAMERPSADCRLQFL